MSFWDNNKDSIMSGLGTAGKATYRGAKSVGKAGYNAAKNHQQGNLTRNDSAGGVPTEAQFSGEARNLNSFGDVSKLPPPPLKPGQKQYTSEKLKQGLASSSQEVLHEQGPASNTPATNIVRALPQAPTQPHIVQVQQRATSDSSALHPSPLDAQQLQQPPQSYQQQPLSQLGQQSPIRPPTSFTEGQMKVPELDYNNPYYQGATTASLTSTLDLSRSSSEVDSSAPPPLAPRNYTRDPVPVPGQLYSMPLGESGRVEGSIPESTPSPDLSHLPLPPKRVDIPIIQPVPQAIPSFQLQPAIKQQQPPAVEVPITSSPPTMASASVKQQLPLVPGRSLPSLPPNGQSTDPVTPTLASKTISPALNKPSTKPSKSLEQQDEPLAVKSIAGKYNYTVDVKFAPPPTRKDIVRTSHQGLGKSKSSTLAYKSPTLSKPPPVLHQSAASPGGSISPPPPPARGASSVSPVNFPPPPKPSAIGHHNQTANLPPPLPPSQLSQQHQPNTQSLHSDDHIHPPPAYSPTPGTPSVTNSVASVAPHQVNNSQFAPPPKPYRGPVDTTSYESELASLSVNEEIQPSSPLSLKSKIGGNSYVRDEQLNKKGPPPLKPKPSIDASRFNKIPPVMKPKLVEASGDNRKTKVPPPLKPKPSFNLPVKKTPPSVKPIPTVLNSEVKSTIPVIKEKAVGAKHEGFSALVSELPSKDQDDVRKVEIDHAEPDSGVVYEEDPEDNPFRKYLKSAVPKEDDRFRGH